MNSGPKIPPNGSNIKFRSFVVPEGTAKSVKQSGISADAYVHSECASGNCHFSPEGPWIPIPDLEDLTPILHHLAEKNTFIRDNYRKQARFLESLAATAWLSIEYARNKNMNITNVKIGNGFFNIDDVNAFLTKKFATLLGNQILHPDRLIHTSVATMIGIIPSASMLKEGGSLNIALNRVLSGLSEDGEKAEKAMLVIKRLSPHLSTGHRMVYEMAHQLRDAIFEAKGADKSELEAKLLKTYSHLSINFREYDSEVNVAKDIFTLEKGGDRPEIVRIAATDGLNMLNSTFPSLAFAAPVAKL